MSALGQHVCLLLWQTIYALIVTHIANWLHHRLFQRNCWERSRMNCGVSEFRVIDQLTYFRANRNRSPFAERYDPTGGQRGGKLFIARLKYSYASLRHDVSPTVAVRTGNESLPGHCACSVDAFPFRFCWLTSPITRRRYTLPGNGNWLEGVLLILRLVLQITT